MYVWSESRMFIVDAVSKQIFSGHRWLGVVQAVDGLKVSVSSQAGNRARQS